MFWFVKRKRACIQWEREAQSLTDISRSPGPGSLMQASARANPNMLKW
jgi:hypothetical protein